VTAPEFRAQNVRATRTAVACGHEVAAALTGRPPELCPRCRRESSFATRLRQAAEIAAELGYEIEASWLTNRATLADPRRVSRVKVEDAR
jgi:TPP-dependent indolepyruvate ferredoxin oxidoreductase alpha subunit